MRLFYQTDWERAAIRFCLGADSGDWRTEPLVDVPGALGWKQVDLASGPGHVEFVMSNEEQTAWDNPPPESGGQNYRIPKEIGAWTLRQGRLTRVAVEDEPLLVVSDLDNTMVGHSHDPEDAYLREFQDMWLGRYAFGGSTLVYSTGRNFCEALAVCCARKLLRPKLLICSVGTEVYHVSDQLPLEGGEWANCPEKICMEPQWMQKIETGFDRDGVEAMLRAEFPRFSIERSRASDPYRIPTQYTIGEAWGEDMHAVRQALGPAVQVISSGDDTSKYVDFLSAEAGKLGACEFVMSQLNVPPGQTLVCGDSGNDEGMFRCPGVRGVAVGNSLPELVEALRGMASSGSESVQRGQIVETTFGSSVLYARRLAAGAICEALETFWPQGGHLEA